MDVLGPGGMAQFVGAILVVAVLVGLLFISLYAIKRFRSGTPDAPAKGKRQPRVGVIETATLDERRRLVIIRRDNVEHLVMIGGPTDVVVETNIIRTTPTARDIPAAVPVPQAPVPPIEDVAPPLPAARELGPVLEPEPRPPERDVIVRPVADATTWPLQPQPEPMPAPEIERPSARPTAPRLSKSEDENLAEMAQRLEAALRRPVAQPPVAQPSVGPATPVAEPSPPPTGKLGGVTRQSDALTVPPDAKEAKGVYESLEQEMASLLGRPPNKT